MLHRIIALILFSLTYIIGLIGNGLLIFIVFRQKNLRTVPNLLVVNLALGDFLFVLFCVPFGAVAYLFEYYPFSTFYCRFENFIINLSLGVSVFSLLALSADRYKIIIKPFSSHADDPSIKLKLIVIFIWFISALLALPETIYSGLITVTTNQVNNETKILSFCWSPNEISLLNNHIFMITRQILRLIIYYLLPLIFITIFYSLIAKTLFRTKYIVHYPASISFGFKNDSTTRENRSNSDIMKQNREILYYNQPKNIFQQNLRAKKQLQARYKLAKIVLVLCVIFFICWLPKQLYDLYWYIGVLVYSSSWNYFWQIHKIIAFILTYIYSCINPFALCFLSPRFRYLYKSHCYSCFNQQSICRKKRFPTRV